jgi:hypothetical protein
VTGLRNFFLDALKPSGYAGVTVRWFFGTDLARYRRIVCRHSAKGRDMFAYWDLTLNAGRIDQDSIGPRLRVNPFSQSPE